MYNMQMQFSFLITSQSMENVHICIYFYIIQSARI